MKSEVPLEKDIMLSAYSGLLEDKHFVRLCLDIAGCMIIVLNRDQTISFVNRKSCEILGNGTEEILGRNWFDAFVPEYCREETKVAFDILISGDVAQIEHYENPIITRDGDERTIAWHNVVLRDEKGLIFAALCSGEDITERRRAEAALRDSEEKFRIIFETSRDAIMLLDRGGFFECNQACLDMYGCTSKEQFVSKHPGEWSPLRQEDGRDSLEAARERIEKALEEGTHAFEWTHKRLDGTVFPAEVLLSRSEYGGRTVLQATVRDISERKKVEERLKESEEKYRNMFENAVEGIYQSTPDGRVLSVNPAQARLFGYSSPQEMIADAKNIGQAYYVRSEDREICKELMDRQGFVEGFEVENYTKNREKIWISLNTRAVKDDEGRVLYYEGMTENITQRKRTEQALKESERRLSEITEFLPDPMFAIDLKGKVVVWNQAMVDLTGIPAKDMIGKGDREYALPFYQVRRPILIDFVLNPGQPGNYYASIRQEGDTYWAEADLLIKGERRVLSSKAKPLYGMDGKLIGAIETIHDITDRKLMEEEIQWMNAELQQTVAERTAELLKANRALEDDIAQRIQAEESLRESERKYREMAELLPETVFECDINGRLTFVNGKFTESFGYGREDLEKGLTIYQVLIPEDRVKAGESLNRILKGEPKRGSEYTVLRKDGSSFPILSYSSPIMDQGHYVGVRGVVVDISDLKRVEAELLKVQKLESVGILAGGIAHDFNNLLATILGYIDLTRMNVPPDGKNDKNLERARAACLQAAELTKRLITFSIGGDPLLKPVSLAGVVEDAIDHVLRDSSWLCKMILAEGLWPVSGDDGHLKQVAHHLIANAREAMPGGGVITVSAENFVVDERTDLPLPKGAYVKWSVMDSGSGIPPENLSRIFDPYFTTKDRGSEKGMGLGLAICYSVVKRHHGLILVESESGMGATFNVYLPAGDSPDIALQKANVPFDIISKREAMPQAKILLMDDEGYILELLREMLGAFGYGVETAENGNEAVALFRRAKVNQQPFAAVILDLEMPDGRGGLYVMQRLLEIDPSVKAIVASGYSNDPVLHDFGTHGFMGAIAKPFTLESLGRVLEEVIGVAPQKAVSSDEVA
ncbi:MAG: PAS domain S-box protein [Syntrophaceae bacterium]|nr:PAS domain S-box protein [Syntrophaceae bacterium]